MMTRKLIVVLLLLTGALVLAGPIHVWRDGELIKSATLNANFAHIHNNMVGGGHNKITAADLAPGMSISKGKVSGIKSLPTAYAETAKAICSPSLLPDAGYTADQDCGIVSSFNISSITGSRGYIYIRFISPISTRSTITVTPFSQPTGGVPYQILCNPLGDGVSQYTLVLNCHVVNDTNPYFYGGIITVYPDFAR